jgi:hypothetical protein
MAPTSRGKGCADEASYRLVVWTVCGFDWIDRRAPSVAIFLGHDDRANGPDVVAVILVGCGWPDVDQQPRMICMFGFQQWSFSVVVL